MSIPCPDEYNNELMSLVKNFNSSLEEMSKVYPNYKLNTNTKSYLTDKNKFFSTKHDIDKLKNNLSKNVEVVRTEIGLLNNILTDLDIENKSLTKEYRRLNNLDLAAKGELGDQELISRQIYISNIILLFIILSHIVLYYMGKL